MPVVDLGLQFEGEVLALLLYTGMIQACFQYAGTHPWLRYACVIALVLVMWHGFARV